MTLSNLDDEHLGVLHAIRDMPLTIAADIRWAVHDSTEKGVYPRLRRLRHEQLIDSVRLGFPDSRVQRFFLTEEGQTDLQVSYADIAAAIQDRYGTSINPRRYHNNPSPLATRVTSTRRAPGPGPTAQDLRPYAINLWHHSVPVPNSRDHPARMRGRGPDRRQAPALDSEKLRAVRDFLATADRSAWPPGRSG